MFRSTPDRCVPSQCTPQPCAFVTRARFLQVSQQQHARSFPARALVNRCAHHRRWWNRWMRASTSRWSAAPRAARPSGSTRRPASRPGWKPRRRRSAPVRARAPSVRDNLEPCCARSVADACRRCIRAGLVSDDWRITDALRRGFRRLDIGCAAQCNPAALNLPTGRAEQWESWQRTFVSHELPRFPPLTLL